MNRLSKGIIAAAAVAGVAAGGVGIAGASGATDTDDDIPITGDAYDSAVAAALAETGGGEVTETEIEEDGTYEVEITMDDGTQLEVMLDESFGVIGVEDESNEGPDDD